MITDTKDKIISYIASHKKTRPHDLVKLLGISHVAVHKQLRRLLNDGKIKKTGTPPLVFYSSPDRMLELEEIKRQILPILKKADVKKAAIFGSYARGDNTKESDIDILVDLPRGKTLFDLSGLKINLEEKLEKKVDVVTYNGISKYIKDSVLSSQYSVL